MWWTEPDLFAHGAALVAALPVHKRPGWIHGVLTALAPLLDDNGEAGLLQAVVAAASRPAAWPDAAPLFHRVRALNLASNGVVPLHRLLETCCKEIYNATAPSAPFDRDASAYLLPLLAPMMPSFVLRDAALAGALSEALFRRPRNIPWPDAN